MRIGHFDCFSGISGDMTLAVLLDAGVDAQAVQDGIASLQLPVRLEITKVKKNGIAATSVKVEAPHEHKHRHLPHIEKILDGGTLTDSQRDLAKRIFRRLAEAEAKVHNQPIEKVHFHEVGALDSITDIAGSAIALDLLGVDRFTSTPVATGSGTVQCEHGLMPVPAPATAELLKNVPLLSSSVQKELTTPTGAAILTTIVDEWIDQPAMTIEKIGYGAGQRELEQQPNVLRLFVGDSGGEVDSVWMLETNIDDMPSEIIGYCYDLLLQAGALDVYSTPIYMKKNRPGVLLSVIAPDAVVHDMEAILFRETSTFGVRKYRVSRRKLSRRLETVETRWGPIRVKVGERTASPEYEDCARVAKENSVALRDVYRTTLQTYYEKNPPAG